MSVLADKTKMKCLKGVSRISDILDEEGNFLSFPEFKKKYKIKTNFLRYFGCATPFLSTGKKPLTATLKMNQLLQDNPQPTL